MPNFAWAILLKPLIAIPILIAVKLLAKLIMRCVKSPKIRALLLTRLN